MQTTKARVGGIKSAPINVQNLDQRGGTRRLQHLVAIFSSGGFLQHMLLKGSFELKRAHFSGRFLAHGLADSFACPNPTPQGYPPP